MKKINMNEIKRLMILRIIANIASERRLINSFVRTLYHISRDETIIIRDIV